MIGGRGLDCAFDGLGARVGQKDRVGEGVLDKPRGIGLALRTAVEVRHVHQRRGLILDRLRQMRMAVTEKIDRDAARKVEITLASLADQIGTLAAHRTHSTPGVRSEEHTSELQSLMRISYAVFC